MVPLSLIINTSVGSVSQDIFGLGIQTLLPLNVKVTEERAWVTF